MNKIALQKRLASDFLATPTRTAQCGRALAHYWLLAVTLLLAALPVQAQWTDNQPAVNAIGQPDFTSSAANNPTRSATTLRLPRGVSADPTSGKVFVADTGNNRVLRYSSMAAMLNGQAAEGVLGQTGFTTAAQPSPPTPSSMNQPFGVFVDSAGRLWVAEFANNRVLRFDNAAAKADGAPADGVLGQPDFTTNVPAITQSKLRNPSGLFVDGAGRLWVADRASSRILRFDNAALKANGDPADGVLGKPDFTTTGIATTPNGMWFPSSLFVDGAGRLWVADTSNQRVLRFDNAAAKANGANADNQQGQPDFNSGAPNNGGVSATSFSGPQHLFFDGATYALYAIDVLNNRVKRYTIPLPICPGITLGALNNALAGSGYAGSAAATPAGGYSYSVLSGSLPAGFALNSATGALTGLTTGVGVYSFTLKAQDTNGCSGTQSYTLLVNCPGIALTDLPVPSLNTPYNQIVSATPAGGNYSFAVTAGALPNGLSLNPATGVISGTPTVAGAYSFTLTAAGFGSCTGSRTYSGALGGGGSCVTITLAGLPAGSVGQSYVNYATAAPAGSYSYAVTAGSLPPGLTLYVNGLLYGYPALAGSYNFTITATDGNNCSGMRSYTIAIN